MKSKNENFFTGVWKLKSWFTLEETSQLLSQYFDAPVGISDLCDFALDGYLLMSVRITDPLSCEPLEEKNVDLRINRAIITAMRKEPSTTLLSNIRVAMDRVILLTPQKKLLGIDASGIESPDCVPFSSNRDSEKIDGVWDIPVKNNAEDINHPLLFKSLYLTHPETGVLYRIFNSEFITAPCNEPFHYKDNTSITQDQEPVSFIVGHPVDLIEFGVRRQAIDNLLDKINAIEPLLKEPPQTTTQNKKRENQQAKFIFDLISAFYCEDVAKNIRSEISNGEICKLFSRKKIDLPVTGETVSKWFKDSGLI